MGDRVFFATVEAPTPSGFNGFPIPFTPSGADGNHPVSASLDDTVKMYWRVKNWELNTDVTVDGILYPNGDGIRSPGNASTESEIQFGFAHDFDFKNLSAPIPGTITLTLLATINQDSGVLYPEMIFSGGASSVSVQFDPSPPVGAILILTVSGSIMGISLPVYFFSGATPSITGSQFDLVPLEYWPYANSQGLPVWDTATGAQLRNPRS